MKRPDQDPDVVALANAVCRHAPDVPLPPALADGVRRVCADEPLREAFQDALRVRYCDPETRDDFLRWFDVADLEDAIVERGVERQALGLIPSFGPEVTDLGIDIAGFAEAVAKARERERLGDADVLFLREGRIAPLRLKSLGKSLAAAVFDPVERFGTAVGEALRAVLLPASMPDGAQLASAGASVASAFAIDPKAMDLAELPEAEVSGVETLRLEERPGTEGGYVFSGSLEVTLVAASLPEGTFPGGVLMVIFPLRVRRTNVCFSSGAELLVDDAVTAAPNGWPRLRLHGVIEEGFRAPLSRPRLDLSGIKVVLVPREICQDG